MSRRTASQLMETRNRSVAHIQKLQWQYRVLLLSIVVLISLVFGAMYLQNLTVERRIYEQYARDSIITIKKDFLKDNVNNMIRIIDGKRQEQAAFYRYMAERVSSRLALYETYAPDNFKALCIAHFSQDETQRAFSVLLLGPDGEQVFSQNLLETQTSYSDGDGWQLEASDFPIRFRSSHAGYVVDYGISQATIDLAVQEQAATLIHQSSYSNDAYIWVNEILNYAGGQEYAIRRVHPNLPETEGMLLSTDMTDIQGNFPYLEELEGVRENGEVYFTYFFKKRNQDVVSEKLTYAQLYKPYNWVVAMGIHLDDVQAYMNSTLEENRAHVRALTVRMGLWLAGILGAAILLMLWLERWYIRNSNRSWKVQTHMDALTGAANRRAGMELLEESHQRKKRAQESPILMMMDIDDFKRINDTYGHPAGDEVLITLSRLIGDNIRNTDTLCRWGGEEFLLFCEELPADRSLHLAEKLLDTIRSHDFGTPDAPWHITLSIGISWHGNGDREAEAAVRRADKALYDAKHAGKDQAKLIPPAE